MHVAARSNGDARVRLRYRLRVPSGVALVPVAALRFHGFVIEDVVWNGAPVTLAGDRRLVAELPVSGGAAAGDVTVDASYRVRVVATGDAPSGTRVRVPVLAVLWPPAQATPGTFTAEVEASPGVTLRPVFPAGMRAAGDVPGVFRVSLPVAPAMLAFDLPGDRPSAAPARDEAAGAANPGWPFWGLFAAFGAIVALYVVWLRRVERR